MIDGIGHGDFVGAGRWFFIDGNRDKERITQSDYWHKKGTPSGSHTNFTLDPHAAFTEEMVGWYLQPDVNTQAYLPITAISGHIITVAGKHYTLHRHYDPSLMRFTSPDPVAAQFWNLHVYAGNSPGAYRDPDGLDYTSLFAAIGTGDPGRIWSAWQDDVLGVERNVRSNLNRYQQEGYGAYFNDVKVTAAGYSTGIVDSVSPYGGDWIASQWAAAGVDITSPNFQAGRVVGNVSASVVQMALTGGGCMWAKGLAAALAVSDLGHAAYAYQTGDVTSAAATLLGQAVGFGAGRLAKGHFLCFVGGTQVLAQDSDGDAASIDIEDIEAGDYVWARNDQTGEEGFKLVVETYVREAERLVHLSYSAGSETATIVGTDEHPFWSVTAQRWVNMGDLKVGEELSLGGPALSSSKSTAVVTGLKVEFAPEVAGGCYADANTGTLGTKGNASGLFTVYNFQVADHHTYFAAPEADKPFVWVHNANYKPVKGWKSTQVKPADYSGPFNNKFTSGNSSKLKSNMRKAGVDVDGLEAHHIVPSTHTYESAKNARALLDEFQIDINSALNGAALKNSFHHGKGLHSYRGMDTVLDRLRAAKQNGGRNWGNRRAEIIKELRSIASEMEMGIFKIR